MADDAPLSGKEPLKAKPEVVSTPPVSTLPKDGSNRADRMLSPAVADRELSQSAAEDAAGATFAHTKQHVADRQTPKGTIERFANTKNNIALINDPKNGPRFTLTKKESGLVEKRKVAPASAPAIGDAAQPAKADTPSSTRDEAPVNADEAGDRTRVEPSSTAGSASPAEPSGPAAAKRDAAVNMPEEPRPMGPLGVPPGADPPSKVPVDSSKTFVGPNGTYYDESWRWMDWRGTKQSWNWSAALSFGHWFAYRRLYGHAALYLLWLGGLTAALVNNVHAGLIAGLFLLTPLALGAYANTLYFMVFRRAVAHVTERGKGSYDDLKAQLARSGGVNAKAPWMMAVLTLGTIAAAIAATYYGRGGFQINLWPF